MALQHTIKKAGSVNGVGLHTAAKATITINPAAENYGIRFVRTDLENAPEIPADIDYVVDNSRGTCIGIGNARVYTIEHLMAAFAGLGIDNCRVEVTAEEIPLMDGSALPFVDLIKGCGIIEQAAQREFIVIDKAMLPYVKGDIALSVFPSDHFHVTLMVDYKHPAIGAQHTTLFSIDDFEKEFAPARTFCFLSEIEKLREAGLIKGGSLESAVVVQDVPITEEHLDYLKRLFDVKTLKEGKGGLLNDMQLRYPNELCRHKALDLIGDLYLLGKPILGHVMGARTGHAANIEMAKKIREYIKKRDKENEKKNDGPVIAFDQILEMLPHRYPFLLVDAVNEIDPGKKIVAYKNVTFNDHFFQGHFPGNPIMPGVLQLEAMAQAGGLMALYGRKGGKDNAMLFMTIDKVRFRGIVRPGDQLMIECETLQMRGTTCKFAAKCLVRGKVVSEAEMMAMVGVKKDKES